MIASAQELEGVTFRTSSYCGPNGPCVEFADLGNGWYGLRDSKDPEGPVLKYPADQIQAFVRGLIGGEFPAPEEVPA